MMAGIQIGIASETRAFKQGVDAGIIKPTEDAVKALDNLGKTKGPDQLEDGLKAAQKATDNLADETKQTARTIEREYRDSYRDLAKSADDGYGRVKESARSAKEEAVQNFAETAASFDGSAQGIADGIQGTFGGLATALPLPLGIAAGAIGIIGGAIAQSWSDTTEAMKEKTKLFADDFIENGTSVLTEAQVLQHAQDILSDATGKLADAQKLATGSGVDLATTIRALSGDQQAAATVREGLNEQGQKSVDIAASAADANRALTKTEIDHNSTQAAAVQIWNDNATAVGGALGQLQTWQQITAGAGKTASDARDNVNGFSDALRSVPAGISVPVTADTSQFFADMERIRRQRFTATLEVNEERRGRQII